MAKFYFLLLICTCIHCNILAQDGFFTQDLSDKYYAKACTYFPDKEYSPAWVAVYSKATDEELIKADSVLVTIRLTEAGIVHELLPDFGKVTDVQNVVLCEDFNFDGIKDIAIIAEHQFCPNGFYSYQIYLDNGQSLVYSEAFTRLFAFLCSPFKIDMEKKRIYIEKTNNFSWHGLAEYRVENDEPILTKTIDEDFHDERKTVTTKVWEGEKIEETSEQFITIEEEDPGLLFSFNTDNNKRVVIFVSKLGGTLYYALLNEQQVIEVFYPEEFYSKFDDYSFDFKSSDNQTTLSFNIQDTTYTVYSSPQEVGLTILANGETQHIAGIKESVKGSLAKVTEWELYNVVYVP